MTCVDTCRHQYKHNGQTVIHKSTSECYKTTGTRTSGTGQHWTQMDIR